MKTPRSALYSSRLHFRSSISTLLRFLPHTGRLTMTQYQKLPHLNKTRFVYLIHYAVYPRHVTPRDFWIFRVRDPALDIRTRWREGGVTRRYEERESVSPRVDDIYSHGRQEVLSVWTSTSAISHADRHGLYKYRGEAETFSERASGLRQNVTGVLLLGD